MSRLLVLDNDQIDKKINRLAYQILEENYKVKKIYLAGINNAGQKFANLLSEKITAINSHETELLNIRIDPSDPSKGVTLSSKANDLKNKNIVVVDDVANTGRTIFYACKPILDTLPKSVQVAVLVDRKHKAFPIKVDYVGLSLATTLKENIVVELSKNKTVYLE